MAENVDFDKVKKIIIDKVNCDPEKVKKEASFVDLGFDSLDAVETIMAFEEEFDIEIPDEEADKMKTVGDAIDCISEKLSEKAS
ncbi:acyl carrier protein [Spirochaetota bacterium]|nr:acyl carrier protein [Spirochaetota bacterium]